MLKKAKNYIPATRIGRFFLGVLLLAGGLLGFLPVLGFWMIPLGIIVLSVDSHMVRRFRRRFEVRVIRKWKNRKKAERRPD